MMRKCPASPETLAPEMKQRYLTLNIDALPVTPSRRLFFFPSFFLKKKTHVPSPTNFEELCVLFRQRAYEPSGLSRV